MKIGIEAKWFFHGPPSGRAVIQNLVEKIIELETEHKYYIFLDKKDKNRGFPYTKENVHTIYLWGENNLLSNVIVLPIIATKLKLDIVVFQNFVPVFANFKRYAYIHDTIFKTNPEYYSWKERLYLSPLRLLANTANGICTVSESEKSRMLSLGYGKNVSIDVIHHGVADRFMPKEYYDNVKIDNIKLKYHLPPDYLLYVGRLNVRKNIENLLMSMVHLDVDIPLVIVGEYDWKSPKLEMLISELDISNRVLFTGAIDDLDLPYIYALSTIFCFPSYEEAFGLPALEAMASGVPVVVSCRSSLPEICGDAGTYLNPDDHLSIAECINTLLRDKVLWNKKRTLGLLQSEKFRWEFSAKKLLECVEVVAEK